MSDTAEFVFDAIDVKEMVRERGRDYFQQVSAPMCDFCGDVRVRWEYDCGEFIIDALEWGSDDKWVACDRCSTLIDADDRAGALARAIRAGDLRGLTAGNPPWAIRLVQDGFFDNRIGERRAFG